MNENKTKQKTNYRLPKKIEKLSQKWIIDMFLLTPLWVKKKKVAVDLSLWQVDKKKEKR